ncbi:hypothetical protein MIR68_002492 [Amoeboaphelidium protococcarum]|nr:hypothetical protein MIR68_002492 [Amoeboaphelidium protococcarum]
MNLASPIAEGDPFASVKISVAMKDEKSLFSMRSNKAPGVDDNLVASISLRCRKSRWHIQMLKILGLGSSLVCSSSCGCSALRDAR